ASPSHQASFTSTTDQGLRTLSGGQLSIQVDGYLAIETDAAPKLVIETTHAARDIFAVVKEAPVGGAIDLQLRQGSTVYTTLSLAAGDTISNIVGGFALPPLVMMDELSLDILGVPGVPAPGDPPTLPGRDLTVTVRL